jgi:hypothetical protein
MVNRSKASEASRPVARRDAGPSDNSWIMLDGRLFFAPARRDQLGRQRRDYLKAMAADWRRQRADQARSRHLARPRHETLGCAKSTDTHREGRPP